MSRRSMLDESRVLSAGHMLVRAENATITLADPHGGIRDYTDLMSAYGAVNFGHCNPGINPGAGMGADIAACFYPPEAEAIAEWLCKRLRLPGHDVLFQIGGSFGVSGGLALAERARSGRVLAIEGAFHGLGQDTLAVTGIQHELALQAGSGVACLARSVDFLKPGADSPDWRRYSCLIFEPVQGANGYVPLDQDWIRALACDAQAAGVIVIADEVQSGYYRHGELSVSRAWRMEPDVLVFSKSMTNGLYPLSAVVFRAAIAAPDHRGVRLAHTFQTGVLGYRAAMAVARYLDRAPVATLAIDVERELRNAAQILSGQDSLRKIHVTGPTLSFGIPAGLGRAIVRRCFSDGVIAFVGGPNAERIRVAPPLTIPTDQLAAALDKLIGAVAATMHRGKPADKERY